METMENTYFHQGNWALMDTIENCEGDSHLSVSNFGCLKVLRINDADTTIGF